MEGKIISFFRHIDRISLKFFLIVLFSVFFFKNIFGCGGELLDPSCKFKPVEPFAEILVPLGMILSLVFSLWVIPAALIAITLFIVDYKKLDSSNKSYKTILRINSLHTIITISLIFLFSWIGFLFGLI